MTMEMHHTEIGCVGWGGKDGLGGGRVGMGCVLGAGVVEKGFVTAWEDYFNWKRKTFSAMIKLPLKYSDLETRFY